MPGSKEEIAKPLSENSLKSNFERDKGALIDQTNQYLNDQKKLSLLPIDAESRKKTEELRNEAKTTLSSSTDFGQAIGAAIRSLEQLRDLKNGIVTEKLSPPSNQPKATPTLIRDARKVKDPAALSTEAFEIQYLNVIRAATDIANIEGKASLAQGLKDRAQEFVGSFHEENQALSQKDIAKKVNQEIIKVIQSLEKEGIQDARDKVNVAKDFQNLKDDHSNIATISSIEHGGKKHTIIEAEVGLRGLTNTQKEEYIKVQKFYDPNNPEASKNNLPKWFEQLRPFEKALCHRNLAAIIDGKHVLSTQLRQIVGMKNAFEKITAIKEENQEMKILHESKHAGTIASFARGDNTEARDSERARITAESAKQAQEWIGKDRQLHCLTLNSGPNMGTETDKVIVSATVKAMNAPANKDNPVDNNSLAKAGRATNLAYNLLRMFGKANVYDGLKEIIEDVHGGLTASLDGKKPSKALNANTIEEMEKKSKLGKEAAGILRDTVVIISMLNKADRPFRLDLKNISADIIIAQTNLMDRIAKAKSSTDQSQNKGLDLNKITTEESLIMCASGKDRTGFAQHDASARKIQTAIGKGIELRDIDKQLLRSRHTASQAGSIHAGGASLGAFGTKVDNIQSLPIQIFSAIKNRFYNLKEIIEVSSAGNNLPKMKKARLEKLMPKIWSVKVGDAKINPAANPTIVPAGVAKDTAVSGVVGTQNQAAAQTWKNLTKPPKIGTHRSAAIIEALEHPHPHPQSDHPPAMPPSASRPRSHTL
ncbi:MAG: hypothetical protein ACRYE9_04000 [Janthinobacterium lividum]